MLLFANSDLYGKLQGGGGTKCIIMVFGYWTNLEMVFQTPYKTPVI